MARYFEELEVWKEARRLVNEIYRITRNGQFSKDYCLVDQIRRAGVSIMSNIAEGFERGSNQEFLQFLYIPKGSCGEVRAQIYVAFDQGYIDREEFNKLVRMCKKTSAMTTGMIEHLKGCTLRGDKFKAPPRKSPKEMIDEIVKEIGIDLNKSSRPKD